MVIEAALTGNRTLAIRALAKDPLLCDLATAEPMLDEMLQANRQVLPRFFGT